LNDAKDWPTNQQNGGAVQVYSAALLGAIGVIWSTQKEREGSEPLTHSRT